MPTRAPRRRQREIPSEPLVAGRFLKPEWLEEHGSPESPGSTNGQCNHFDSARTESDSPLAAGELPMDELPEFDVPVFKKLAKNDTGQAKGNQSGPLIPEDLISYFPKLSRPVRRGSSTVPIT